ncbi:MAG: helix-turn-helix transcriptional regulator [Cyclobacteriaceae bacterium]|nr:helix-turn-helix transcriptional regulator [Cyclobacteriaceae bacterium]
MEAEFTVLENTRIGKNILNFRRIREKKASEVARHVGLSEAAYTKYERGESQITVTFIQKVAEFLEVDPLQIISASPSTFFENVHNSSILNNSNFHTFSTTSEEHLKMLNKLMESVISLNERMAKLIEGKKVN